MSKVNIYFVVCELKKGAKIKVMVLSRAPLATSDVVCTLSPCENSDVCVSDIKGALYALLIGRKTISVIRQNLFAAFAVAVGAVLSASGLAFDMLSTSALSAISLALSLAVVLNSLKVSRFKAPVITSSEDDEMFGKVNYTMKIDGMSCAHCSARVKTALESLRGVSAKISLEEKTARIKCPASTDAETLAKAVSDVGFTVVSTERV